MNTDSQTYEYDFDGERIVITEQEVREFYSETYRLTKQDIKGFAAFYTAKCKYFRTGECRQLTPALVRQLLDEEHLMKPGESDSFRLQLHFLWFVRIRRENERLYPPFKYALEAFCLDNIQSFSRRYITLEKALLHCLNRFNENAAIRNDYRSLEEYFQKQTDSPSNV